MVDSYSNTSNEASPDTTTKGDGFALVEQYSIAIYHFVQEVIAPHISNYNSTADIPTILLAIYLLWTLWRLVRAVLTPSVLLVVGAGVGFHLWTDTSSSSWMSSWKTMAMAMGGVCSAHRLAAVASRTKEGQQQRYHLLRLVTIVVSLSIDVGAMFLTGYGTPRRGVVFVLGSVVGLYVLPWLRVVDRLFQLSFWLGILIAIGGVVFLVGAGSVALRDEL